MKNIVLVIAAASICLFAGCSTPARDYAAKHPELSPAHRQILMNGKIPDGDAVAGMTRDQIQLVMGQDATQYTKVDGHDAWIYVKKKLVSEPFTAVSSSMGQTQHDVRNRDGAEDAPTQPPEGDRTVKTTIIFDGDVATHAEVVNGGL